MIETFLFWTVYALIGVGVARAVLKARVRVNLEYEGRPNYEDPDVAGLAIVGGVFWPATVVGTAAWFGLIRPVVRVVGPKAAEWFMAPSRALVKADKAERARKRKEMDDLLAESRKADAERDAAERLSDALVSRWS